MTAGSGESRRTECVYFRGLQRYCDYEAGQATDGMQ
jgi:hypothetical protein